MRKWIAAAILMLLAGSALAQEEPLENIALCAPKGEQITVTMYEEPSEDSDILMNYFEGVMVEVLDEQDGWTHIQTGPDHMQGYVREKDLEKSAKYQRTAVVMNVQIELMEDAYLWNSCKEKDYYQENVGSGVQVPIIGFKKEKDGTWLQADANNSELCVCRIGDWQPPVGLNGYFFLPEEAYAGSFQWKQEDIHRPIRGEMTYEQAYEKAIEAVESGEYDFEGYVEKYCPEFKKEDRLKKARTKIYLYGAGWEAHWVVWFEDDELEGTIEVYLSPDGKEVQMVSYGVS